ncbi:hypothetical protein Daus18300_001179 [Diaporthe australafricana]|uniref:Uncharacterized protein n=1 Tax=Diaporthe australafricana TaxID=127596 RepID=A0ABR3XZ73_9PEZI
MSEPQSDNNKSPGLEDSATSNGLRILIPDTENPAEPNKTWLKDGTMAQNESARAVYEEGDSFAGLKLERIWDADVSSPASIDEDLGKGPDIEYSVVASYALRKKKRRG